MSTSRIPGAVLMALGLGISVEATTFEVGFLTDPVGPKALPLLVGVLLTLAGAHALARPGPAPWPERAALTRVAAAVVLFLLYGVALAPLGFFLSTTLAVAGLGLLYGAPAGRAGAAAMVLAAALWVLFVRVLALPLPVGDLWTR